MNLNVKAFALACGVIWGLGLFGLTWWIIAFDGATGEPTIIGKCYRGYTISPIGSVIGLGWGLVDGVVGGAVFAWLYNVIGGATSTRTRLSQIMNLLNLAPEIQSQLLYLPQVESGRDPIIERDLRPIASIADWRKQRRMWRTMSNNVAQWIGRGL